MQDCKYNILLESDNIYYMELNEKLIDDYLVMMNDYDVQSKVSKKRKIYTFDKELEWVNNKLKEKAVIFSMLDKKTGEFVGNVEFMHILDGKAEIGISITPRYQDKHYGTEALKTMIDYGFNELSLDEIYLIVFSNNHRAIHCYQKLGFVEYKIDDDFSIIDEERVYDVYMRLLK